MPFFYFCVMNMTEITIGVGIALAAVAGLVLLIRANKKDKTATNESEEPRTVPSDCCGAHEICEFDLTKMDESIIEYFDDEELDQYKNIPPNSYTDEQIEQFREVLYTLQAHEIKKWLLSIERRHIQLPEILNSEARMLMAEA